jgi:hypothetical protein
MTDPKEADLYSIPSFHHFEMNSPRLPHTPKKTLENDYMPIQLSRSHCVEQAIARESANRRTSSRRLAF